MKRIGIIVAVLALFLSSCAGTMEQVHGIKYHSSIEINAKPVYVGQAQEDVVAQLGPPEKSQAGARLASIETMTYEHYFVWTYGRFDLVIVNGRVGGINEHI